MDDFGNQYLAARAHAHANLSDALAEAAQGAEGLDVKDVRAVLNGHESECSYHDGGDFTCSCGYDEAAARVDAWIDEQDASLRSNPAEPLDVLTRHDWRLVLWESHGHEAKYGDDGEMQCWHYPPADFLRDSPDALIAHIGFDMTMGLRSPESDPHGRSRPMTDTTARIEAIERVITEWAGPYKTGEGMTDDECLRRIQAIIEAQARSTPAVAPGMSRPMTDPAAPTTEAGRQLIRDAKDAETVDVGWVRAAILAIEAEARTNGYWSGVHDGQHKSKEAARVTPAEELDVAGALLTSIFGPQDLHDDGSPVSWCDGCRWWSRYEAGTLYDDDPRAPARLRSPESDR